MLAVIGIVAKVAGALYRVPLTNTVGAEGMGLYQMVFPVYTVLLAVCGGGIANAVSRVVAKYSARGDAIAAAHTVKIAAAPLFAVSAVLTAAIIIFRNDLSALQGNADASLCYLALAPSLLFAGGTAAVRGYFQGRNNMLPSGVSQLIEQSVKLFAGLCFARMFLHSGVRYAVAGALLGVTASEFTAAFYLGIRYAIDARKRKNGSFGYPCTAARPLFEAAADGILRREILSLSLPLMLGALVMPITQVVDSALVINLLVKGGEGRAQATALFGLAVGPVGTLINMPTVILSSVSVAFLPALTADLERGGDGGRTTKTVFEFVMMFVIPITVAFLLFPESICRALYGGLPTEQIETAARILRVEAVSVFYAGVFQVSATVLQAHGNARRPTVYLAVGGAVNVALTPVLVIATGIYGSAAATCACYCVAAMLTVRRAVKTAEIGVNVRNAVVMPIVCSAAGAAAYFFVAIAVQASGMPALWQTVVCASAFFAVYAAGMTASGALRVIIPSRVRARREPNR